MSEITMPQNVRTMTFEVSGETKVNFSANYNSVAIRSTGDVGITEYSGKQIGDNGVLKCKANESVLYPNLISKKYIYLVGSGIVEILVGNNLTVNPFKNGGKGGETPLNYLGITTTALADGDTTNPIMIDGVSVTAKKTDWVIYDSKDFIFNGTVWQEVGDFENYYTKSQTDTLLSAKANVSDVYAKTDTYSKTQADDNFINKTDISFNYEATTSEINAAITNIWGA